MKRVPDVPYPEFMARGERPACTKRPDLFVNSLNGRARAMLDERAKAHCKDCPFRQPCARWATATHQTGIWGGTNDTERALRRKRYAAAA
jgi:hypothetical protein